MWRIIFKMLMARKGRYGWLLTELVVVSIAVWVLVDPLVVQTSIELQDKGFDEHRLYRMELKTYSENYPHFVEMDEAERHEAQLLMLRMVRSYPGVASATFQGNDGPFCSSTSINMFRVAIGKHSSTVSVLYLVAISLRHSVFPKADVVAMLDLTV